MELLYLSKADIESLNVPMKDWVDAVELALRLKGQGKTHMPPKPSVYPRENAMLHPMPAYVGEVDVTGVKWISGYPSNPAKGLPYISGLLILNDPATGIPIAVMDATYITARRTGASVGVAARYLGRRDATVAGLLGCGVQAREAYAAYCEVLPELKEVRVYDKFPEASKRFVETLSGLRPSVKITVCEKPQDVIVNADIAASAIPIVADPDPAPFDIKGMKPGFLGIGLDYDVAWTQDAIRGCDKFFSDDIGQLLYGKGHSTHLKKIPDTIYGELGEAVAGVKPGRENAGERIFSMQMGIGIEDMVAAKLVYDRAMATGAGTKLPL